MENRQRLTNIELRIPNETRFASAQICLQGQVTTDEKHNHYFTNHEWMPEEQQVNPVHPQPATTIKFEEA